MRQNTFISKIDDLQRWFDLNQQGKEPRPYFTLWRGYESKADRIILRNTEISESDKAWELLEEMIEAHADGGGSFRVFVTDKPAHNFGLTTLVNLPSTQTAGAQVAGIHGIHGDVDKRIQDEVDRRIEMYELKREIEDLKSARTGAISGMDQFREVLTEFPELRQLGYALGMKMMGIQGAPVPPTPPPGVGGAAGDDHAEGYDYDVLEPALDQLGKALGTDVETTMQRLANWATQNPQLAKQMLQNLPTS